ncbi:flavodoxin domain-containing protein [Pseudidiomarina terrestris]|uniref:flavodoxin domain-containing protein n=1 Tax=Pseudidiomarina terrestris TaxID=2820060 RepID=UPI0026509A02|nr:MULTISPECIES: flavodoxin domain-containing protein [unclassified Pseudidiomarina]MDN7127968.1 flavodoxin domain-containing protein [Pseudidiomarina sp. 1APR75-33.1]MDN7135627.1 flavodoxin domain-containing protein [Pseudidiomarina sp. 1ASP75-5]
MQSTRPTIDILVATTSGNTEYLADQLNDQLTEQGFTTRMHYEPDYTELVNAVTTDTYWLACIASHGAGEYGDSMLAFADDLHAKKPPLDPLHYAVIAVGDSCYDTYCEAGRDFDRTLKDLGAKRLTERLEIDMSRDDPEKKASTWLGSFTQLL